MEMTAVSSVLALAIVIITILKWSCALTPATCEDGSGVDAPEVTTLQYCIIDNSTILRLDTGEQLDIVYTKDSILVVTSDGCQTAIEVSRPYNELVCSMDDLPGDIGIPNSIYLITLVWTALVLAITGYNIIIHLLYKKLRCPMGKLLMLYSIFMAIFSVDFFLIITFIHKFPVSLNHVCHTLRLVFTATYIGYETTATCILAHSAYHMRQSYKMIPVNPREDKMVWRRYLYYIIGTIAIAMLMILTYDVGTTEGRYYGYCSKHHPIFSTMLILTHAFSAFNVLIQIAMFIAFLYYYHKMRYSKYLTDYQINKKILLIAVVMGATISVANFLFLVNRINARINDSNLSHLVQTIGAIMQLLQHSIIVGCLRWVKQVYKAFCMKESTNSG